MTPAIAIEIAGWVGMICVLVAYILLSFGRMNGRSPGYHILNLVGASGFIVNTWAHGAIPSFALNVVWAAVGLAALARIMLASSK